MEPKCKRWTENWISGYETETENKKFGKSFNFDEEKETVKE